MDEAATRYFASNRGMATLYAGVLLPPAAWLLHLTASFTLATQLCGGRHEWVMHLVLPVPLLMTAAAGVLAWRNWRVLGGHGNEDREGTIGRSEFLAVAGLASTAFFGLIIIASEVPNLFLPPCHYG